MTLSERQKRFCELYVKTGNATQSYIDAGYKARGASARANASKLLTNPNAKSYIEELTSQLKKDSIADADRVLQFLTKVMDGEVKEELGFVTDEGVEIVSLPINGTGRIRAAAELLKRYPLPVEVNLNTPTAINVNFDFKPEDVPEPED
ncbi:terminase small subunit [Lactococcus lactis]|uniref:terminase small subunit n=1 Tax=Lactococcus lactis TaxID=1358 RepID=UPI00288CAB97|nr:terminase small subunit [Lactococcus lactis]MDT2889410.1 terminase small subunit [Lactococcus lactis]MDT2901453.1 terminase small subunit [Lactococcus lactis]MDT2970148.1 terminase small subunit [Lactococcus lactis]